MPSARRSPTVRDLLPAGARLARERLRDHDVLLLAAALAFYALIAVVPLLLLALWTAGLVVGDERVRALVADVAAVAPDQLGFATRLTDLGEASAAIGLLTVAAALVPATTYGDGVLRAFDRISGERTGAKGVRGRLRALALLAVLPLLVALGLAAVAVLRGVLPAGDPGGWLLGGYVTFLVTWLGATLLLAVTYAAFSPLTLTRRGLWWSAAATGSFLAGMSLGWVAVLTFGVDVGRAYGGAEDLGALVLLAVYLYLVQLVCLLGYAWALGIADAEGGTGP